MLTTLCALKDPAGEGEDCPEEADHKMHHYCP